MLHILVVDDEPHIAYGVGQLLEEHREADTRVWKALSVKQAITVFENNRIDLLVTDIQMPGMNGLDLVTLVQKHWPNCKVIFLTGYSDYEYLHFALQHQVAEYLLKPLEDEVLLQKIDEVIAQIKASSNLEALRKNAERQLQQAKPLLIREIIASVLSRESNALTQMGEQLGSLNIELSCERPVMLMLARIDYWPERYSVKDKLLMEYAIHNILEEYVTSSIQVLPSSYRKHLVWLLQSSSPDTSERMIFVQISETLTVLQETILNLLQLKVSFVLAPQLTEWERLGDQYESLASLLKKGIGMEQEIIIADENNPMEDTKSHVTVADMKQSIRKIITHLETMDTVGVKRETSLLFQKFAESVFMDYGLQLEVFCELSLSILEYVNGKKVYDELEKQLSMDVLVNYSQVDNLEAWERYCQILFPLIIEVVEQRGNDQKFLLSEKVDAYIIANLNGDLSLTNLAKQVYLSPYYLSRLYFAERGSHLSERITALKMSKAKEFLADGTKKIYEIALDLGFENTPYFSRFFKKHTGLTPQQFKESNRVSS